MEVFEPERNISLSREISKKFEETFNGTLIQAMEKFKITEPRGEFVVVIQGAEPKKEQKKEFKKKYKEEENQDE